MPRGPPHTNAGAVCEKHRKRRVLPGVRVAGAGWGGRRTGSWRLLQSASAVRGGVRLHAQHGATEFTERRVAGEGYKLHVHNYLGREWKSLLGIFLYADFVRCRV
eukprot:3553665-Prymnesium_polylepis.1